MRKAGVLLHISSLPGDFGCGTFGKHAYAFADFLSDCGFTIWQVLPFNVPHRDASPYSSISTFAQNPLFIDPDILCEKGLLKKDEVATLRREVAALEKDYFQIAQHRKPYWRLAAERAEQALGEQVRAFLAKNPCVDSACRYLAGQEGESHFYFAFLQYEFAEQWNALHEYLAMRGIEVIGDIPIYADLHSSEVHDNRACFRLDEEGKPQFVSGVPGDSFNDAGQKWGHPLYDTEALEKQNYALLFDRMAFAASVYDVTRIDHFQAIASYYAIPADGHPRDGHWERGVGEPFVRRLVKEIGADRFIVEDFNCFPGGSHELADKYGLPDMNTLQFTLNAGKTAAGYPEHTVAYTGTHDNDTLLGYFTALEPKKRARVAALLGVSDAEDGKALVRSGICSLLASVAERVVIQAQDLLCEGSESRMNVPGISGNGNWMYRLSEEKLESLCDMADDIRVQLTKFDRLDNGSVRLLKNDPFDITEYCGHLIVTYLSEDKEQIRDVLEGLDRIGYEYIENEVGMHTVLKSSYISDTRELLDNCGCYLLFLSKHFDDKRNRALRNNIWYQVGVLESRRSEIVVPFMLHNAHVDLSKSPLQQANTISRMEEIVDMFHDKFKSTLARNEFYADPALNSYTKDRVDYRRMLISLNITPEDFEAAMSRYRALTNDYRLDEAGFITALRDKLSCGVRLLSFGAESRLTTHLSPYREEIQTLDTLDFPINFTCQHLYKGNPEDPALKAEYHVELILPIHRLLGVNFKAFLRAEAPLTVEILQMLFASNFTKKSDVCRLDNKLYFSMNFPNAEPYRLKKSLQIGIKADYLFPQ